MGLLLHQYVDINNQNMAGTDREKTYRNVPEILTWNSHKIPCHSCFELLALIVKANGALQPSQQPSESHKHQEGRRGEGRVKAGVGISQIINADHLLHPEGKERWTDIPTHQLS